jgi:hypothetical protein
MTRIPPEGKQSRDLSGARDHEASDSVWETVVPDQHRATVAPCRSIRWAQPRGYFFDTPDLAERGRVVVRPTDPGRTQRHRHQARPVVPAELPGGSEVDGFNVRSTCCPACSGCARRRSGRIRDRYPRSRPRRDPAEEYSPRTSARSGSTHRPVWSWKIYRLLGPRSSSSPSRPASGRRFVAELWLYPTAAGSSVSANCLPTRHFGRAEAGRLGEHGIEIRRRHAADEPRRPSSSGAHLAAADPRWRRHRADGLGPRTGGPGRTRTMPTTTTSRPLPVATTRTTPESG